MAQPPRLLSPETKPFICSPPDSTEDPCCVSIIHEKTAEGENETTYNFSPNPNGISIQKNRKEIEVFEREPEDKSEKGCRNFYGILLALFAGFVFTVGTILAKFMKHYHPFTLAMFRVQGILLPSVFMVIYVKCVKKVPVFEPIWPLSVKGNRRTLVGIFLRCAIGCTALFLHFGALKYLQVGDVAVVSSCKPIFVTLAAFIFLGETCGIFPVLMAFLTVVGVGVIMRPPLLTGKDQFDEDTLIGAGFALASVITDTFVVVIIRSLKKIHVTVMMLFLGIWASIQSIVCASIIGELKLPESRTDWVLAIGMALVAILNQGAMHMALQFEQANPVAITRTMDFIFAFLLQFLVMGIAPDLFSLSGAAIIIMCVLFIAFRKWLNALPTTHIQRKRFWFVLK